MEKELIKLKGTADGVKIYLDSECEFSKLMNSLYEKIRQFRKFFGGGRCNIYVVGRELSTSDKMRLDAVITGMLPECEINYGERKVIKAEDSFEETLELPKELLQENTEEIHNESEEVREIAEEETELEEIKEVVTTNFKSSRARFYEGVVKAGKTVFADGHLTLFGDVEEGGMITAVGNVIVIGSIKGSVEAGCMGNDNAYIFALDFKPTDVRISKTHCNFDEFDTPNTENPKKAYLINNQICVDDFLVKI